MYDKVTVLGHSGQPVSDIARQRLEQVTKKAAEQESGENFDCECSIKCCLCKCLDAFLSSTKCEEGSRRTKNIPLLILILTHFVICKILSLL